MWFHIVDFGKSAARDGSRRSKKRGPRPRRAARRLGFEPLESRAMLSFLAPVDYAPGGSAVAVGEFANDGVRDLAVAGYDSVSVLTGNGDGSFQPARSFSTNSANNVSIAVGDVNGDGNLDIVTAANYFGYSPSPGSVSVLLGKGDGRFQAPITFALPDNQQPGVVALGDMNHDGILDAVVTTQMRSGGNAYEHVDVLFGQGNGHFSLGSEALLAQGYYYGDSMSLADFNGDGNLDVATTAPHQVAVLLGNGDGTLQAATDFASGGTSASLAVGDVNGDGNLDLATANFIGGGVSVLLGNGDGSFQTSRDFALPNPNDVTTQNATALVMGDLNDDGRIDLAVTAHFYSYGAYAHSYVNILLGNGQGDFTDAQIVDLDDGNGSASIIAADFNGNPDLALVHADTVQVLLNGADWLSASEPSSFNVSGFPSTTAAGTPGSFTVKALNADGTPDTGYTGTVYFSSTDGQASLPAPYTFTAADGGVHTFSATLKTAGTQSIGVFDSAPDVTGSETSINVTPAAPSRFYVSAPATVTAGVSFDLTVTVEDAYGNIVTDYTGTINFSSSDRTARLPRNYTFTAGDNGVHTFTGLVLKKTGNQTISVSDTQDRGVFGGAVFDVLASTTSGGSGHGKKGH